MWLAAGHEALEAMAVAFDPAKPTTTCYSSCSTEAAFTTSDHIHRVHQTACAASYEFLSYSNSRTRGVCRSSDLEILAEHRCGAVSSLRSQVSNGEFISAHSGGRRYLEARLESSLILSVPLQYGSRSHRDESLSRSITPFQTEGSCEDNEFS